MTDNITPIRPGVRPISSDNIRRIFGPHVITEVEPIPSSQGLPCLDCPSPDTGARKSGIDLYDSFADDSECTDELTPRIPAWELVAMLLVAAFIGFALATGGML